MDMNKRQKNIVNNQKLRQIYQQKDQPKTLKKFSLRILQRSEAYLEPSQTFTMEHFC